MIHRFVSIACRSLLPLVFCQFLGATPYAYVDATPTNTTLNGAALVDRNTNPTTGNYHNESTGSASSATDGRWGYRTSTAYAAFEGGACFESDNVSTSGDAENTAPLVTAITLGTAGTYEIVAVFARNTSRDIAAKIGSAPTSSDVFTTSNALNADQNADPLQIDFDGSYANGRAASHGAAHLGQVTTTSNNQTVSIHINGFDSLSGTQDERTQYEGIGYRLMPPPEPKHRDVFLIAGQSNADGRGLKAELTGTLAPYAGPQPGVLIHYTNTGYTNADKSRYRTWTTLEPGFSAASSSGVVPTTTSSFGVEIGAAKILTSHYPNPAFIKVARGGTMLGVPATDWYPAPLDSPDAGPLYKALIESTQLALAELAAAGDSYTVHALFWHQGEGDGSRTAEYGGLLTTLIESVRRDLGLPNLRLLVGELAPLKPQSFRDVQWQTARSLPNAGFISSSGLTTSDAVTHFDTASIVTFGRRLGHALRNDRDVLDFEFPMYFATGALDRQDEWSATTGLTVETTASQGEYPGGQAAGHKGPTGTYLFNRRQMLPLDGARTMQADFFPGDTGYDNEADADSSLLVSGWSADVGNDGQFAEAESAIGMGFHPTGAFRIQIGATSHLTTGFNYQTDRWYRLTLAWSEPDTGGIRTANLLVRDLSTGTDLNGGAAILSLSVPTADFSGDPARWLGVGCRATCGLIDNIRVVPPGFTSWMGTFHPSLAGGLTGDDDQDSIANAIELAFGLDPLRPDSTSALPQPVFGPTAATVSFTPLATQPGVFHAVEWSRNLSSWGSVNGTRNGSQLDFTISTAEEPRVFIRHGVKITP